MFTRLIAILVVCFLAAEGAHPAPCAASSDSDRVPVWVPGTVIGAFVVGSVLYWWHQRHDQVAQPLPPRERAAELVAHLATREEREELSRIDTEEQAAAFLDRFYARRDPTPGTPRNEFREDQLERYRRADELYGTNATGWGGDRRRLFFIYGPPDEQMTLEVRGRTAPAERWRSAEIWVYNQAAGSNELPPLLRDSGLFDTVFRAPMPVPGQRLFLFINEAGEGACRLGFSTEPGEAFDHSIYRAGSSSGG